jgi:hypothetical protein
MQGKSTTEALPSVKTETLEDNAREECDGKG